MQVIPLLANPNQSLQILLDNQAMSFRLYQRNSNLYIDIYKEDEPLCFGQKCVFGSSVIRFSQNLFKGSLHFIDMTAQHSPEYSSLGSRFYLIYLSENEAMPEAFKW